MKIKVLKVIILTLICTLLISFSVLPCFAESPTLYGSMLSHSNVPSMSWRVNYDVSVIYPSGSGTPLNLDYIFSPVFPTNASRLGSVSDSFTNEVSVGNGDDAGVVLWQRYSDYLYDTHDILPSLGYLVSVNTSNSAYSSNDSVLDVDDISFHARDFYYTYSPDMVAPDIPGSPFYFYFLGDNITAHLSVDYSLIGSQELRNWNGEFGSDISFTPSMFGYSDDDSFSVYIHNVYFSIDSSSWDLQYEYGYYPDFIVDQRDLDLQNSVIRPSDEVYRDYTSWIGTAISGFMSFQIFEGFSFGSLLMVIISFSVVMWFLKLFAGG